MIASRQALDGVVANSTNEEKMTIPLVSKTASHTSVVSMCGICPEGCGAEVHLTDGRIQRISSLKDHPHSVLCTRGMKTAEIVYSPDRLLLLHPTLGDWRSYISLTLPADCQEQLKKRTVSVTCVAFLV